LHLNVFSQAELHHPLLGGKRISDGFYIPLCYIHHRGGKNDEEAVSRHPYKKAFIERYGTEQYLHDETIKVYSTTYAVLLADV
jgi:hypothetical protein